LSCARRNTDGNVRVNQDCGYRQQAEELIKWNPRDPNNLIAGMNDLRQGYTSVRSPSPSTAAAPGVTTRRPSTRS
jgi:hypothetical protein